MTPLGTTPLQSWFDACGMADLVADGVRLSATALHHGANDWARAFRRAGIARGDRVVCALPNGAALTQLVTACLAEGVTCVPIPAGDDVVAVLTTVDARVAVAQQTAHPHVCVPSRTGGPPSGPIEPRRATARTDSIAFLLRTSGTSGAPRWIALSETGVQSVLESHLPVMSIDGGSALCTLPWHHAFGLILGLLPALLRARRIVTAAAPPRDAAGLVALASAHAVTHMSMVPLTAMRLSGTLDGMTFLRGLHGGLVGGAAIDTALAAHLTQTRLRVGYGQTEASPGIMVGNPGEFSAGFIGRPLGCAVRIESDGVLAFRGPNACAGMWVDGGLRLQDPDRWQRTEDIVSVHDGAYTFLSRASVSFKLANGTLVVPPFLEATIRLLIPRLSELALVPTARQRIAVLYSTTDDTDLATHDLERALGGLRTYVDQVTRLSMSAWPRTPKGDLDRRALMQAL